jgi:hypothetical protein
MVEEWRPSRVIVEDTAAGPTIIRALREELASGKIRGEDGRPVICEVRPLTPAEVGGDKEARLDGVVNQIAAGMLLLLEGAAWVEEFVNELCAFPRYPTKDRVDALTACLALARIEDRLWPEARAARAREEAIASGAVLPPTPTLRSKLNQFFLGIQPAGERRDIQTGEVTTKCAHAWVNGKCRLCGK